MTSPTGTKNTCPHCGAPMKNRAKTPPAHLLSSVLALAAAFFFWNARQGGTKGDADVRLPGRLSEEAMEYLVSPSADNSCRVCLTSADKFLADKKAAALLEKTKGMVRIKTGEYPVGSPEGVGDPDERPQHQIYLDAFYLDKNEVTIADYMRFVRNTAANYPEWAQPGGKYNIDTGKDNYYKRLTAELKNCPDCPVVGVTARNADAYCGSLNKRLPTEAEWEAAARGGTGSRFSFGDDPAATGDYAWYENNSGGTPHPVGRKKPNAYGLYDMHGNAWEWTADRYDRKYYAERPKRDPKGPGSGGERTIRGGSWAFDADSARAANRASSDKPNDDIGFRCSVSESAAGAVTALK